MVTPFDNPVGFHCFDVPFSFDVVVVTTNMAYVYDEERITHALEHAANISYGQPIPFCPGGDVLVDITDLDGDSVAIPFSIAFF
jgi:hypothetical protein